jgi:hypothetical protein
LSCSISQAGWLLCVECKTVRSSVGLDSSYGFIFIGWDS